MTLPIALALWLFNACLAGLFGYWLGRIGVGKRCQPQVSAQNRNAELVDDQSLVLDELNAATKLVDGELGEAIADFETPADPNSLEWSGRIGNRIRKLLFAGRAFEQKLSAGHERISRRSGGVWPSLANEIQRHRDRVVELCSVLDREVSDAIAPTSATVTALLNQVRSLTEQNRRLRQELVEVKAKLADREANLVEAERQARLDALTRLPNRRSFDERLSAAQTRAEAGIETYALILFDLDQFKVLNDEKGHPFGDAVLSVFGRILTDTIRASDHAARFGGEEFVVLLPGADNLAANAVAERCRRQAERSVVRRGATQGSFTVSGGVSAWEEGYTSDAVLSAADRALYAAKSDGRNRIHIQSVATAGDEASADSIEESTTSESDLAVTFAV